VRGFLLDTHIWFWYLVGSERLPEAMRGQIAAATTDCWLSPVSVWELGLLARHGRVDIPGPYRAWVATALERVPLRDAALNREVVLAGGREGAQT
jgi:PIN domain nuclease of toxin-antitoxin system